MGEPISTRRSYDLVADRYLEELGDELVGKPLDRALLAALAELAGGGPVLDVGCGPGHVSAHLAGRGLATVGLDVSSAMCTIGKRTTGLPFVAGDMTALPLPSNALAAVVCFYAVIHLDHAGRATAYAEFSRVLRGGGHALVAFHTSDAHVPIGGETVLSEWWGNQVDLTFRFLDPSAEARAMARAGLEVVARMDRGPHPAVEHPSRRTYLLLRGADSE